MPLGNLPAARSATGGGVEATPVVILDPSGDPTLGSVNVLAQPGAAKKIPVNASSGASASVTLSTTTRKVSVVAIGSAMRYAVGTGTVTASANSHLIAQNERLDFLVPLNGVIAALSDSATAGTLEITELL